MADKIKTAIDETANRAKSANDQVANTGKDATDQAANVGKDATHQVCRVTADAQDTIDKRIVEPARRAGEALREAGKRVDEGRSSINVKMIDHAETNTHLAFEALRRAARAENVSDVITIQGEFLREQAERATEQAREIGELIVQFGREAIAPLREAIQK